MIAEILLYASMLIVVLIALKPKNWRDFFSKLSLKKLNLDVIVSAVKYLFFLLLASFIIGVFFYFIGMEDDARIVSEIIKSLPVVNVAISVLLASFIEEIMFRGYLVKKTGILVSSFLFALSHAGYGSLTEIVGAFVLGVILARQFLATKNLWANILTHLMYNTIVVWIVFSV